MYAQSLAFCEQYSNEPLEIIFLSNEHSLPIVDFKKVLHSELLYGHKVSY